MALCRRSGTRDLLRVLRNGLSGYPRDEAPKEEGEPVPEPRETEGCFVDVLALESHGNDDCGCCSPHHPREDSFEEDRLRSATDTQLPAEHPRSGSVRRRR